MLDRSVLPRFASIHLDSDREVLRDRRVLKLSYCGKVTSDSPAFTTNRHEMTCRMCRKASARRAGKVVI